MNATPHRELTINDVLHYETRSRTWLQYVPWGWAQDVAALYIAWVVRRKYARYRAALELERRVEKALQ